MLRRRICILIGLLFSLSSLWAQTEEDPLLKDSKTIIAEGVALHDNEEYDKAIATYQKVLPFDTNYITALYEQTVSFYSKRDFESCERTARKILRLDSTYINAYVSLANALDDQGKTTEALKIYDLGLESFPFNHLLWLNKGVLYEQAKEYQKAYDTYLTLLEFNPMFSSTHLRLGLMAVKEGRVSQGLISLTTFLCLEPASGRSFNVLRLMDQISAGGYQEMGSVKKGAIPDEMESIDFLFNNKVALNKKYKVKAPFDYNVIKQIHMIIEQARANPGSGFWWNFYVPYLQSTFDLEKFPELCLYLVASSTDEEVKKKVQKNLNDVLAYQKWFQDAWYDQHKETMVTGKPLVAIYNSRTLLMLTQPSSTGEPNGLTTYYYKTGTRSSQGEMERGLKTGSWIYFNAEGDTTHLVDFKEGKLHGLLKAFYSNGELKEEKTFANDELNGPFRAYFPDGAIRTIESYKNGKGDGSGKRYYPHGELEYEYTQKEGLLVDSFKSYYSNGQLKDEYTLNDKGKKHGQRKQYMDNGQLSILQHYDDGQLDGSYESFHWNGKLESKGMVAKDNKAGAWENYFSDGSLSESESFDENGKVTGLEKHYDYQGKILMEIEFKKGSPVAQKVFDESGNVIYEATEQKGEILVKDFAPARYLNFEGKFVKGNSHGEWVYYYPSGEVSNRKTFEDGVLNGRYTEYFENGQLEFALDYVEGSAQGWSKIYNAQGKLLRQGTFHNDKMWGPWDEYFVDGSIETKNFLANGSVTYKSTDFYFNGHKQFITYYDDNGEVIGSVHFDTNGAIVDSMSYPLAYGSGAATFKDGSLRRETNYLNGWAHGSFRWMYPNGKINTDGEYYADQRHGDWKWYYADGSLKEEGSYAYGDRVGTWKAYGSDGKVTTVSNYIVDNLHGEKLGYYPNGKKEFILEYWEGERHGPSRYFDQSGELKIVRYYEHGILVGYSYHDKEGKLIDMIPIQNGDANVVAYYSNGQKSVEYSFENGDFHGDFKHYFPNGKLSESSHYVDGYRHGKLMSYHPNGKVWMEKQYKDGKEFGVSKEYYSTGKPSFIGTYKLGEEHGVVEKFTPSGKGYKVIYNTGMAVSAVK